MKNARTKVESVGNGYVSVEHTYFNGKTIRFALDPAENVQLIKDLIGSLPGNVQVREFGCKRDHGTPAELGHMDYPTDADRAQAAKRLQEIIGNRRSFPNETYVDDMSPEQFAELRTKIGNTPDMDDDERESYTP